PAASQWTGRPGDLPRTEIGDRPKGPEADLDVPDGHRRTLESTEEGQRTSEGEPNLAWCDPMARSLLQLAQPVVASPSSAPVNVAPIVLDQIAAQLVRKAGVGGSSVHLQVGAGRLEGGEVLVQAGADGLDVRISAPAGVDGAALASAISE